MFRNKKEIIINIIGIVIILIIIAVLATYLSTRKKAVVVSSGIDNTLSNIVQNSTGSNSNEIRNESNIIIIGSNTTTKPQVTEQEHQQANTEPQNTEKPNGETSQSASTEKPKQEATKTDTEKPKEEAPQKTNTEQTQQKQAPQTNTEKSKNEIINEKINELNSKVNAERQGVIYLTFDDGPSAKITPKVLDILKEENIKATFFVINFSSGNEHLVKRIVEEGHTIGIHGYSHEYSKIYKSKETFMDNVYTLQKRIKDVTGVTSTYTRFPGGSSNTVSKKYCQGIMSELTLEMIDKGFKYFDWNISSGDAGGAKTSKDVYNNVTKNLKKTRQNMVLMHDFGSNQKGLDALRDIIKFGKDNGYTFMKIDEQTPFFAQHVAN